MECNENEGISFCYASDRNEDTTIFSIYLSNASTSLPFDNTFHSQNNFTLLSLAHFPKKAHIKRKILLILLSLYCQYQVPQKYVMLGGERIHFYLLREYLKEFAFYYDFYKS